LPFQKKEKEAPAPKQVVVVPESEAEKFKALFALSNVLDKKHQTTNSLMQLGKRQNLAVRALPTNLPSLDNDVFGAGGIPRGRIIEVFGPESAGKTTATLHFVACEQRLGGIAAFVDAEHALDPAYAKSLGVDVDKLVISQPSSGEEALDIVLELVKSKLVTLIVVDSVAALVPQAELTGEMGDSHVGLQARLMSQAMRKLVGLCWDNQVTVIFINQIREKIGVMFGSPETTTGGRALKFYSSIRLDVRRREVIREGGENSAIIGHQLELQAVKNKVGNPFRKTKIDLYYPNNPLYPCGFDMIGDLITYCSKHGFFEMSGSWYWLDLGNKDEKTGKPVGNERLANGIAALKLMLRENQKVLDILSAKAVQYHKASLVKPVEAAKAV
jgi:recombination protein RecA